MKTKRKMLSAGLLVAVVAVPLLVKINRGGSSKEVDITVVTEQDIRPTILTSGVLEYLEEISLTSELVAKVRSIHVTEGDTVSKGQLLLSLDPEMYLNAIQREQASRRQGVINIERQRLALELAEKRLARGELLLGQRALSQSDYDDLRSSRDLAHVELQSSREALLRADAVLSEAREQLLKTEVRAPIDGTVVDLPIKVGETAIPSNSALAGATLMRIADTSAIRVVLSVDEADIARIAIGQVVDVYATAFLDIALKGVIQRIALAPTVESQARSYEVIALIEVPKGLDLRSGMSARADIFLDDGTARLAVPVEAISTEEEKDGKTERYVWVDRDGVARRVIVEVGLSDDRWEAITAGLKTGDRVVTGPMRTLRGLVEGERVREREYPTEQLNKVDEDAERNLDRDDK